MRRKVSSDTWEQVKVAYPSGIRLREIARNMNIPQGTVLAYSKRHGWTKQIEVAKHKAPARTLTTRSNSQLSNRLNSGGIQPLCGKQNVLASSES